MTILHQALDNAFSTVTAARTLGGGVLLVTNGTSFGSPSPTNPVPLSIIRSGGVVTVLDCNGRSGNTLIIGGITTGYTDAACQIGDTVEVDCLALHILELQTVATYTNLSASTQTIGGLTAGTIFNGVTVKQVFDQLFYPYLSPAFTAFGISGVSSNIEVGNTVSTSATFTWTTSNSTNVASDSIAISDATTSTVLQSGIPNSGSVMITLPLSIHQTTPGTHSWSIRGTNNNAGTFSSTFTVTWTWKLFYGETTLPTLAQADIEALRVSGLETNFAGLYTYLGGGYKFLCFPDSLGSPTLFQDATTLLPIAMADVSDNAAYSNTANGYSYAIVSVANTFSQVTNYRVYRTKNILGSAISIQVI